MSGSKLSDETQLPNPSAQSAHDAPLGFTVHSMPAPTDALQVDAARTRMGRWKMLFVLLICASPVVASYWTYYVIRPEGRRNYGELMEPQRPLPAVATLSLSGEAAPLTALKGQWLLLSVGSGACDAACQQRLYFQRQLRETLGKDKDRLDRVWLIQDDAAVAPTLMPALAQATVLKVKAQDLQAWLLPAPGQSLDAHLYLVDPLGNLMMRFPAHMDAAGAGKAKRDLERVLRASAFWDTPGR
jgi:hypothetical protein